MAGQTYAHAKALFLDVLARPEAERTGYLAQASGGNPAVRNEVMSLLGWHRAAVSDSTASEGGRRLLRRLSASAVAIATVDSWTPDVLNQACRRVRAVSLAFAAIWATMTVVNNFVLDAIAEPQLSIYPHPGNVVGACGVVLSLAVATVAARCEQKPRLVAAIGAWYLVGVCLLIAILSQWVPPPPGTRISWMCVPLLFYPAIVPSAPRRMLWTSLAAATMEPLAFLLIAPDGGRHQGALYAVWSFLPNYICALLSLVPAGVIRGLGRQVAQARELGNYRLGERLGQGGMGDVFRATHKLLARPAAIKVIRADALDSHDPNAVSATTMRFRREAEAVALLRSPHTVQLYDFGVSLDGTLFLVMELLEGLDLETLIRRFGPVSPARAVHLLIQACDSLEEAHARGLVHRDIKPSNIVTCRMGLSVDFVKVLDFGLVKSTRPLSSGAPLVTAQQPAFGTPAYLAPEVVRGERVVDHRADIYALGCVAYWLLTGRLVFEGGTPMALMLEHANTPPQPPSQRAQAPLPRALDEAVLACLEKDPAKRPQTARELAIRLAAACDGAEWTQEAAQQWWLQHGPREPHGVSAFNLPRLTTVERCAGDASARKG